VEGVVKVPDISNEVLNIYSAHWCWGNLIEISKPSNGWLTHPFTYDVNGNMTKRGTTQNQIGAS
jgi:hypothetical protein